MLLIALIPLVVLAAQPLGSISFWMPVILIGIGAVSYTHLRAHETVLDLVCRLLLEKKKNKNTSLHFVS